MNTSDKAEESAQDTAAPAEPTSTPAPVQEGFYMPAEWEPHQQAWMGWPRRPDNWREYAGPAKKAYAAVATAIMEFEPVTVAVPDPRMMEAAKRQLPQRLEVLEIPQDDAWFRDSGPTFVVRDVPGKPGEREVAGVDWIFNAWGGKLGGLYDPWDRDDAVAGHILELAGARRFKAPIVLEGGSIHVDGEGTLLTTEECLLNKNRNPDLTKAQIEGVLADMLRIKKFIWLPRGLEADDDTNGHVDNFACFARPGVVLLAWTDDKEDPQYQRSLEALQVLSASADAAGRPISIVKMPLPPPLHITASEARGVKQVEGTKPRQAGDRLAASYINFYMPNGGIVMPAFGGEAVEADLRAQEVMRDVFPERKVVAVPTREILLGGGNIHCITQQQPAQHVPTSARL
ncbi:hypothetical protein WJX81_004404 [Elliptochloris bilobata]|uniref:Agmatine deiminase n=1 Tax=Elliptochloris bilobata TaxID=381761 RepID=A0AAW1R2S9_9CHLO